MWTANQINEYRIFPRVFSFLFGYLLWESSVWYMALQTPTTEQAGFAASMVAAAAAWFKFYTEGKK